MVACAVPGCKSNNDRRLKRNQTTNEKVYFFRFPRNDERTKVWLESCCRNDTNAKNLYICSKHFKPEDYARNLMHELLDYHPKSCKKLKLDANPTLNMPASMQNRKHSASALVDPEHIPVHEIIINLPQELGKNFSTNRISENHTNDRSANNIILSQKPISSTVVNETDLRSNVTKQLKPLDKVDKSSSIMSIRSKEDSAKWHQRRLSFLNHVMSIWLNRSRCVVPNIINNNAFIKLKAKETANILGTSIQTPTKWFHSFKANHKLLNPRTNKHTLSNLSLNISDIVSEEWPKYCLEGEKLFEVGDSKKVIFEEVADEEAACEESEDRIETYDDVLECLKMVEDYALFQGNMKAMELISQIEDFLKDGKL